MNKYKKEIEHYGMLYDYNDSEDYLRKNPYLACDDTANYLALWCINLEVQEVLISNSSTSFKHSVGLHGIVYPGGNCTHVSAAFPSFSSNYYGYFCFSITFLATCNI